MIFVEREDYARDVNLWRYILTALLGIPSFFVLALVSEVRQWSRNTTVIAYGILLALLVAYFFTLPFEPNEKIAVIYRYLMLSIAAHAAVAFFPFWREEGVNGFWQFNKSLFLRIFTASLYSGVLTAGLMIALAACDYLLGFNIEDENYAEVAILIQLFFHPWFFFAGVPKQLSSLKDEQEYPKGLKVFAQFILMSLVMIYLVILYAYGLKIMFSWNWPKGLVSQLILWYSVVGILSLLLLWPLREKEESRWVGRYTKWFFVTLLPLLVMLFLAILQRVGDYGITVNRHVVLALACGLAIVTVYFIVSKRRDIRSVPMVLCLVALLSAYGPLSAISISESSQMGRLKSYIAGAPEPKAEATAIAEAEAVDSEGRSVDTRPNRRDEKSSILSYLVEWHGKDVFRGMVSDSVLTAIDTLEQYQMSREIATALGFEFDLSVQNTSSYVYLNAKDCGLMGDSTFNYVARFNLYQDYSQRHTKRPESGFEFKNARGTFTRNGDSCFVQLYDSTGIVQVNWKPSGVAASDSGRTDLTSMVLELRKKYANRNETPCDELTIKISGSSFFATLVLDHASGTVSDSTLVLDGLGGIVMIAKK